MDEDVCLAEFRVLKRDTPVLANVLQLPDFIKCPQTTKCNRIESLCMLLRRFAYICRYSDMIHRFEVTGDMHDNQHGHIFHTHGHKISQWNLDVLSPPLLQEYADVIHAKGAPLQNYLRFIDGKVRPISRSGQHQKIVYNGHKRVHSLKVQYVALPNGLI